MEDLYIWFNREDDPEIYPTTEDYILKSNFEIEKPKKMYDQNWKQKLPAEIYLIITKKKYKEIHFDYYDLFDVKLVSEKFLSFLNNNGIDDAYYEKAVLHIFDLNGKTLSEKNHFALRFIKDDKECFNFHEESKELATDAIDSYFSFFGEDDEIKADNKEEDTGNYLYPNIELKKHESGKNVFNLFDFYYNYCIIFNGTVKEYVLNNFCGTEIYKVKDFHNICNHYNFEELPVDNKYRIYK
jgi:hypothetical protein